MPGWAACAARLGGTRHQDVLLPNTRVRNQWVMHKLGRYPTLTLPEARAKALAFSEKVDQGIDPRPQAAPPPRDKASYGAVVDQFIETYAKPNQRTWPLTERVLKMAGAEWLDRPFTEITRADIEPPRVLRRRGQALQGESRQGLVQEALAVGL